MIRKLSFALSLHAVVAWAGPLGFEFNIEPTDAQYKELVQPIVNPTRYTFIGPASPTGMTGFDVGVGASFFTIPKSSLDAATLLLAGGQDLPEQLAIPKLTLQKGLPFGLDLGVNFSVIPTSSLKLIGVGAQWAVFNPISPLPTVAVRASYSILTGLSQLESSTFGGEVIASVPLPPVINIIEPYAGVGYSSVSAKSKFDITAQGVTRTYNLKANWTDTYGTIGARLSILPLIGIAADAQFGSVQQVYNARLSVRF